MYFDKEHPSKMFLRWKVFVLGLKFVERWKMIVRPNMRNSNISIWFDDVASQEDMTILVKWNILPQHVLSKVLDIILHCFHQIILLINAT